ncbi:MAG: CPBP family intramembrane metalloprotease, partial [Promethearchaeota archaeon]
METITKVNEQKEENIEEEYHVVISKYDSLKTFFKALAIFAVWMAFTFLLEGMLLTLQRPEAVINRLLYTVITNIIIGTVIALYFVRYNHQQENIDRKKFGFRRPTYTVLAVVFGFILGLILYIVQNPPTLNPIVIVNAYAQVLVVTIAEIIICWVIMGSITEHVSKGRFGDKGSKIIAVLVSSILFGIYHFAHSPPFNTVNMVLLLTVIGIITSVFYFTVRDVYATIVFHNFLGIFGVINALQASGNLKIYTAP